jgi:hypothetical protein
MVSKYTSEDGARAPMRCAISSASPPRGVGRLVAQLYEQGGFVTMLHVRGICLLVIAA